jgi:hypothetical protein
MQVPYTNEIGRPVHVDGKRILPGETRTVDARSVPRGEPETAAPVEETGGSVLDLLDATAAVILDALPELSDEQLQQLVDAEQAGKTRKTVIEGIAEEQLRRASTDDDSGAGDDA